MRTLGGFRRSAIAAREDSGLTVTQAAKGIGLTPDRLLDLEEGKRSPSLREAIDVFGYYGLSLDEGLEA